MAVKVRKRNDGKWYVVIHYKGQRRSKCAGDKRTAEAAAARIRARLVLGDLGVFPGHPRPFDSYYGGWLETYVKAHCKQSTYDGYEATGRLYLVPAFGDRDITEITRDDVKALLYDMLNVRGLARATVKANLAPLREMLNHALDDGHIKVNPAIRVLGRSRADAAARRPPEAEFLTWGELALLLDTYGAELPRWYPFVLLLARTGLRLGEALGLEWSDIDWHGHFLLVSRQIVEGRVETPKSGKARRVDMSKQLAGTLKNLRLLRRKDALRKGGSMPARVFPGVDPDNFRKREWRRMLERAGLRRVPIKALRHTFASLLIANGESLAYVRDQLGHRSIQTTVDCYGHLVPGGNRAAVNRLDDPLPGQQHATHAQPDESGKP